mmetsp:Transcript_5911/g.10141  ORF Transcript_5911/g.10141 Transcript_5911/m.10141 type:complete len:103 (-) Transcript_5911:2126-2434(-)
MVDRRWATTMVVRPVMTCSRAAWTTFSDWVSRAEVASSSSRIFGFFRTALAMAMRCFWPPESCEPLGPTWVSYWAGRLMMNAWMLASCAAETISSSVAVGRA